MQRLQIEDIDYKNISLIDDLAESELFVIQGGGIWEDVVHYIDKSWRDIKKGLSDGLAGC